MSQKPNEFDQFQELAKRLVHVPKKEVDRKGTAWKLQRRKKKERKTKV
jgi:hypothetical protein